MTEEQPDSEELIDLNETEAEEAPEAVEPEVVEGEEVIDTTPAPVEEPASGGALAFIPVKYRPLSMLLVVAVVLSLIIASYNGVFDGSDDKKDGGGGGIPDNLVLKFDDPVMLKRELVGLDAGTMDIPEGVIGYEPSLAVDSTGAMFYTAHKDLEWENTWDYLASWWFISTDGGKTWRDPADPIWNAPVVGMKYVWAGDEGDIAIDAQDYIYYCDTILVDNNFHVFSNGGDTWEYSREQGSTLLDDRPWLTAQGDGILHYLGNNGVSVVNPTTGDVGRVWYYKSADGGMTWTVGEVMVGGWATIDAERHGEHVYVAQVSSDGGEQKIIMYTSDDEGESWADAVDVGPLERNGVGEGMPTVFHGSNGVVYVIWQDSPDGGDAPATMYLSKSSDYGQTFEYWNISLPEGAIYLYPTVNVCQYGEHHQNNRMAVSFYGTTDIPVSADSEWYLYVAVEENLTKGQQPDYVIADPEPLYTGDDLHALHDFYETVISPDGSVTIAYQHNIGQHPVEPGEEQRYLYSVTGRFVDKSEIDE